MPDVYVTAIGFVQFDPVEREANGKPITEATIKTPGGGDTGGKYVRVTIWPEHELESIKKGDLVVVDGKFTTNTYQDNQGVTKTALQISANSLVVIPAVPRKGREVVLGESSEKKPDVPF